MSLNFSYHTRIKNYNEKHFFSNEFLSRTFNQFRETIESEHIGFFRISQNKNIIEETQKIAQFFSHKKHFVQIGIGGSALGPQMLISALGKRTDKTFSLLDNTDSDYLLDVLSKISLKDSVFYVVSKSGGTAETIACYSIVRNHLFKNGISEDQFENYFVFCTDPKNGQLREHVNKKSYKALSIDSNIGGRFSVLSPVGLLPAAFMGIDIKKLFEGANSLHEVVLNNDFDNNPLLQTAGHLISLLPDCHETVMMPYSSKLKDFSAWFVQLWAESLGKFSKASGKAVGLTPIAAYGATDQHAQMQLFMEGPNNKCIFFINIKNKTNDFDLDSGLEIESALKLKNHTMNELLEAEYQGSLEALKENGRNIIAISLDSLNENNLAGLIVFFECLTCIVGQHLLIDPFNQPGVEKGKKYAFEYLNSLRK